METTASVVKAAIGQINETLPQAQKIDLSDDAPLYPQGPLDSLTLTLLIVALEQKVEQAFGVSISLVEQSMISDENNVFRTIATLTSHIDQLIQQKKHA